ncbi:MAG TPA: hypothetical protein VLA37_13910 [Sphingomonadaceae bacterium]|nr:hypothetical protein [Sphingomonadaceae bacterium]
MGKFLKTATLATMAIGMTNAAAAQDRAETSVALAPLTAADGTGGVETVSVEIRAGADVLWSGTLRLGPQYGSASFSQSKNEFIGPCDGEPLMANRSYSSNHQINFNISRRNWQQEPDAYSINVTWTQPLAACEGEGSDTLGFNRQFTIPRGGSISVKGAGDLVVTVGRPG